MVGTVKKSIAAIASRWLRRNASQRLAGSGSRAARRIQREMARSETSKPQHEKFAVDARRSPGRILTNHSEDQLANLLRSLCSPNWPPDFRDQPPIHLKTGPVPTDHRLGRDHDERLFPLRPKSTDGNPEKLVEDAEARPRAAPLQHGELLPEHKVLEDEIPAATEEAEERSEAEQKQIEHGSEL